MKRELALMLALVVVPGTVLAQQIHMSTPKHHLGSSFNESIGCSWGLSGKNWSFNVGNTTALPMFGNYQPGGGMTTSFPLRVGGAHGYFNGWASQSSERFNTLEAPSVTFMNGQYGQIQAVTDTPFVTGFVPVVGGYQPYGAPGYGSGYGSYSVLDERIQRLEQQKAAEAQEQKRRAAAQVRGEERPLHERARENAQRAARIARPEAPAPARVSSQRSANPGTAERPALSVSEMKRRRAQEQAD